MSVTVHERPGVYSVYDAMSVGSATGSRTVGVAAAVSAGTANRAVLLTSLEEGKTAFGAASAMAALLETLYANGAGGVWAVRVDTTGTAPDYASAFAALAEIDGIAAVVCDSTDAAAQRALKESVEAASALQRERVAVMGGAENETTAQLLARAQALNSERSVLVSAGGTAAAAAVAAVLAAGDDPSVPIHGAALQGLDGVTARCSEAEIDLLVRGGVTPIEAAGGTVAPVRAVTTRTTTDGAADATWRELTTVLIADDVIPAVRSALRRRFARSKNTAQTRGAIRSQVILTLEEKRADEIIDGYDEVRVTASESDPTVCLVEFGFTVAHGLTRICLTAHITV